MKKLMTICLVSGLILVFVGPTLANDTGGPIGDPIAGNSWSQGWMLWAGGGNEILVAKWVSGQYFESPTLTDLDTEGWVLAYENPEVDKTLAIATGPDVLLQFHINFMGTPATQDEGAEFYFAVFSPDSDTPWVIGNRWISSVQLWGNVTPSWQPTRAEIEALISPVPAPGAVLLGSIGIGLVGWLRRRKAL